MKYEEKRKWFCQRTYLEQEELLHKYVDKTPNCHKTDEDIEICYDLFHNKSFQRFMNLAKRLKQTMTKEKIVIAVYTSASGYLWSIMNIDGTDMGWSDYVGNCAETGSFIEYEDALEDVLDLVAKCGVKKFMSESTCKKFGCYSGWLNKKYRD